MPYYQTCRIRQTIPAQTQVLTVLTGMSGVVIHHKRLTFFKYHTPSNVLPSERTAVSHLHNTLSNCANSGCFNVCHLKRPFIVSLDGMSYHNWSFRLFISLADDDPTLHEAITALRLSPHSSSWGNVNVTHFLLLSSTLFIHSGFFWRHSFQ